MYGLVNKAVEELVVTNFGEDKWEAIKTKAKQENKPIFVDTYASWCEPCKWMDQNTFSQTTVGDFFNKNYISWKVDVEKGAEFISFDLKNSIGKNAQSESAEILIGSLPTKFTNC